MISFLLGLAVLWVALKVLCFFVSLPFRFLRMVLSGPGAFLFWGFIIFLIMST